MGFESTGLGLKSFAVGRSLCFSEHLSLFKRQEKSLSLHGVREYI
jgi:hypothetical protein